MSIFFYVCAAVCGLAAIQERRDVMRCFGFVIFGVLLASVGFVFSKMD